MLHMEQILYKVIEELQKGPKHLREVSRRIDMNHMTVKRALDKLIKLNVLDIKEEGKNNVYSIKKTIESKNFCMVSEIYKLNKFLEKYPELKKDIISLSKIKRKMIILFGSYAKEKESKESDIDIYIETIDKKDKSKAEEINKKFSVKIGKYEKDNLLIKELEENHIIIKGFEEFYDKNGFFT